MTTFEIVPPHLIVTALRDSGYKNAAYAIAELVDNAVQAGATDVEILCKEQQELVSQRMRKRVREIAVVDNGHGMTTENLRRALQFGNGTRLQDRSGIGRFGMGLPNSSMSQAKRVDVWTWTNGVANAIHSYLDLNEISDGRMREVPSPTPQQPPKEYLRISRTMKSSRSGTVVVWSNLDRCDWRTAHAIFKNSEYTVGRIYRRFLANGKVRIRMASFEDNQMLPQMDDSAVPNDPMYLMEGTSCPAPWDRSAMFELAGDPAVETFEDDKGVKHAVTIRFSVARPAARGGHNPGALDHGKHASNNIGVSVVRAERELELQTQWCNQYDPTERWWGVEVEFPPALDELFGVTNNKQSARALAEFAVLSVDQLADREGYSSEQQLIEAWEADHDPRLILLRVKQSIETNLSVIRRTLKAQTAGGRSEQRHDTGSAESIGTKATERRKEEGFVGASDKDESLPPEQRKEEIKKDLEDHGVDPEEASRRAEGIVEHHLKFDFQPLNIQGPEFFTVRKRGGALLIGLNTNHPAYDKLLTVMERPDGEADVEKLRSRLTRSHEGLKLLFEAWARYEDELADGPRKERAQDARQDWGRVARQFFRDD